MRTDSPTTSSSTPPVSPRASTWRRPSRSDASGDLRAALLVITGAVGLIQLIAWVHLANQLFVFSSDYSPLAARQDLLCQTVVSPNDRMGDDPPRDPKRRFPERHVGPFYEKPIFRQMALGFGLRYAVNLEEYSKPFDLHQTYTGCEGTLDCDCYLCAAPSDSVSRATAFRASCFVRCRLSRDISEASWRFHSPRISPA